jgi:high-affinity Fe2+/Pb2+ permease
MRLLFIIMVILFWVSIWGLSDALVENWEKKDKIKYYIGLLVTISLLLFINPSLIAHF